MGQISNLSPSRGIGLPEENLISLKICSSFFSRCMLYRTVDNDTRKLLKSLGVLSSIGISVVLAIAIGVWFGLWLDKVLGTKPWFFFIFLFIGIVAGFRNIYVIISRESKKGGFEDNGK